jgi:hypothetical protein
MSWVFQVIHDFALELFGVSELYGRGKMLRPMTSGGPLGSHSHTTEADAAKVLSVAQCY